MTTAHLIPDLKLDEGRRLTAYLDTVGVWTIGYGHTSGAHAGLVWTDTQALAALQHDVDVAISILDRQLPWWCSMNDARQDVLANMCFNLGWTKLSGFVNTLAAMKAGRWDEAAAHMLDSKWAKQVGERATRLAEQMRAGVSVPHPGD